MIIARALILTQTRVSSFPKFPATTMLGAMEMRLIIISTMCAATPAGTVTTATARTRLTTGLARALAQDRTRLTTGLARTLARDRTHPTRGRARARARGRRTPPVRS